MSGINLDRELTVPEKDVDNNIQDPEAAIELIMAGTRGINKTRGIIITIRNKSGNMDNPIVNRYKTVDGKIVTDET